MILYLLVGNSWKCTAVIAGFSVDLFPPLGHFGPWEGLKWCPIQQIWRPNRAANEERGRPDVSATLEALQNRAKWGSELMGICRPVSVIFAVFIAILGQRAAFSQWNLPNPVVSFEKQSNGVEIRQKAGILRLEVDAPDVLHVTYSPLEASGEAHPVDRVVVKHDWPAASFDVVSDEKAVTLTTQKLKVIVERESGARHYAEASGKQLTRRLTGRSNRRRSMEKRLSTRSHSLRFTGRMKGYMAWATPGGGVELPRRVGSAAAGKHRDRNSAAGFDQWLRDLLEQSVAFRGG